MIGLRREDKNEWERRVALTPDHVAELVREANVELRIQPSTISTSLSRHIQQKQSNKHISSDVIARWIMLKYLLSDVELFNGYNIKIYSFDILTR